MRTKLHLIAMPWADPELPSIQIGVLKAHMDSVMLGALETQAYSAFAAILLERKRTGWVNYGDRFDDFEEYAYFLLCVERYLQAEGRFRRLSIDRIISGMNSYKLAEAITRSKLRLLETRTRDYLNRFVVPNVDTAGVNLVGFTLNYYQLFASIYALKYLQRRLPSTRFMFLFGGATVLYPKVAEALRQFGVQGLCVIGEGEKKLELIARETLEAPVEAFPALTERLSNLHPGIYSIQNRALNLYEPDMASLLGLQSQMDQLPLPDLAEYYATLRHTLGGGRAHASFRTKSWMVLEGTRGCFAHCDFCDVHTSWTGFRRTPGQAVAERTLQLARRHRSARIKFMDNVCDTWAASYADSLIDQNVKVTSFMECRVHHPEVFWTKLALSGVVAVQVGIESYVPELLKAMGKGTTAQQNLLVQKWLRELGIESMSNLISHHPKSTVQHVAETRRILALTPHLDRLSFSPLGLVLGSPLDRRLTPPERRMLKERQLFPLPKSLDPFFVLKGEYEAPAHWLGADVVKAWDDLVDWEQRFAKRRRGAFLNCARLGSERLLILDGREKTVQERVLEGKAARLYGLCHRGGTIPALVAATGLEVNEIATILADLEARDLLVAIGGCHISLALRPKDELVERLYRQPGDSFAAAAPPWSQQQNSEGNETESPALAGSQPRRPAIPASSP